MIPQAMHEVLSERLPRYVWDHRVHRIDGLAFIEFGPLDVDRLKRLGITVDRLGPRLVVCMWLEESQLEVGGYLVVDNLAMGQPAMGGIRMRPDLTPAAVHNLARGMTLKNAAADLPFGGGKAGIVCRREISSQDRAEVISGFGRLLSRYQEMYIPGPDVGTNDADMKRIASLNGLDNAVSKTVDMGGNRIDELGGAASGVVVAATALLKHLDKLRVLPQFKDLQVPDKKDVDVLIQGFGAVGAHVARIFQEYEPEAAPRIAGISDETGYLYSSAGLPWRELFDLWREHGSVAERFYHDRLDRGCAGPEQITFSNSCDKLLIEPAFCFVPAAPVANYLDVDAASSPSMTVDRMGDWRIIVEGANTYSPDPARKAARRRMERAVYRDRGVLLATDYLVNAGGVIYAAHERLIPTPEHLQIPAERLGDPQAVESWLESHREEFALLAEKRRQAAEAKLEEVIRRNMSELVEGLCADNDSLPCDMAEQISVNRIASREKKRTVRDVMAEIPTIALDRRAVEAAQLIMEFNIPIVAVVSRKGTLIGIVTEWDVTSAMARNLPSETPLTRIMTAEVISVDPECTILDCLRRLENYEISAMPVVEEGQVVGVVSGELLARRTLFRLLQTMA
jgi:glutamate dehydrogenase (NAD(P)+)